MMLIIYTDEELKIAKDLVETLADAIARYDNNVPYPDFCTQPGKCHGLTSCPHDPNCID